MFLTVVGNDCPFNSYALHEYVWSYFGDGDRDFLFRWEGDKVAIMSKNRINKESRKISLSGKQKFSVLVTISRGTRRDENGKRIRLKMYDKHSEIIEWGERNFGRAGTVSNLAFQRFSNHTIHRKDGAKRMVFNQFLFTGEIDIKNPEEVLNGFGRGRAYGYGMMLLENM